MIEKPIWLNMTDDEYKKLVQYFDRKRKDQAVQQSREVVNRRRLRVETADNHQVLVKSPYDSPDI